MMIAIEITAVMFLATVIRSTFGFGEALIAVPLLALVIPVQVAAPVAVLVSITVALIVVVQDWRNIHVRSAGWLVLSTLFGIPLGLLLLRIVPEPTVKSILAIVIVGFSSYSLARPSRHELKNDRLAWLFGFGAGVLGGAYGMNGPPLAVYGSLRGWSPEKFRATLQAYFLPASLAGMGGYWVTGLWTPAVSRFYLWSLPGVVIAIFLGRMINRRISTHQFLLYIHIGLIVIGAILLLQALQT
jgi:uncharacterized membrane protein YfcA